METADAQRPSDAGRRREAIVFDDVSFAYSRGSGAVVDHVSLRIAAGDMVGLLGPNGAGKSTVLRLATRVLRPTGGRLLLQGDELGSLDRREIARRVAVVPQDFSVQFAYTVQQIVEMGRMPRIGTFGIVHSADHQAVLKALESTGMVSLAGRIFNELSGGEKQRALIALALAQDTPILLLDEPTAHLDIRHQIEVLELLRRLNRERGLAVLAALHDLNLAARYFPRLVLFAGL
jgi:iron complex transport system ATP-binding protein